MRSTLKSLDHRRAQRLDVRLTAELRETGCAQRFEVDVVDMSIIGFKCHTSFTLVPGNRVFVTIPGLGPIEAVVAWRRGFSYGCEFDRYLHNAVFDHIVAQYRKL